MAAEALNNLPKYKGLVNFYSYDIAQNGYPNGIPNMGIPEEDLTGEKVENAKAYSLPSIYLFPAGQKSFPYTRYPNKPHAGSIL